MKRTAAPTSLPPHRKRASRALIGAAVAATSASLLSSHARAQLQQPPSTGDRVLGLDVSAWQGNISQTTWNNIHNVENRDFVFIRSSRGGTTGYYDQSNADNNPPTNTLSQRYDDPYFIQNITRATNAGMLAGAYHYGRMDIIASTTNSNGIPNNGTDEANHFIEMAGPWMRPGYLLPVFDFEAGSAERTPEELAQFAIDFSNRIYAVKGIRPIVYIGNNYASPMNSIPSAQAMVNAMPNLWSARWPNQSDPDSVAIQTTDPGDYTSTVYGPWDNYEGADPWKFWQYASTGRLQSYNSGNSNLDFDVAHGDIEFVKDYTVPALWTGGATGNWNTLSNWNSGQDSTQPVPGPGQVAPVGVNWSTMKPAMRLPGAEDNVVLDNPGGSVTVTHSSGTHNIRRLTLNERLEVSGGALSARLTGEMTTGGTLALSGGDVTFTEGYVNGTGALDFTGNGLLHVGTLFVSSNNVRFSGADGTGQILGKSGVANPTLDLLGGTRSFNVADGSASTDLRIGIGLANGNFTKSGAGTLELTANNSSYTGTLLVSDGVLRLTNPNQLGTTGVRTSQANGTTGGTVRVDGNGLNFTRQITLGGLGAGGNGALENVTGNNTWSGNVVLNGTQNNQGQTGLNQISAAGGTALTLSGIVQNGNGASWAKIGAGDVVLTGGSANTYTNLTRVFDGRIILEKDGALGATDQTQAAGSTLELRDSNTAVAFRAPGGSSGFNYTTQEWIFTEGLGAGGVQVDNLAGNNTFSGHLGLGGPVVGAGQEAYLGVSAGSLELKGRLFARGTTGSTGPEARSIFKRGAGTLILSGDSSGAPTNSFARELATGSSFTVEGGTVQLKGTAGGGANVGAVSTWKLNTGAALDVAKNGAAGNAQLLLNGGKLQSGVAGLNLNNTLRTDAAGTGGSIETVGGGSSMTLLGSLDNSAGKSLTKLGSGVLNVNGPQSHGTGAAFTAGAGTTNFNSDAGSTNNLKLAVTVNSGATVNFTALQRLDTLDVKSGGLATFTAGQDKLLHAHDLIIAADTKADFNDNDLLVDYDGASPYERLRQYTINGSRFGTGGITSTTGAADGDKIMAIVDNAELQYGSWDSLTIDTTTIIGKYTYFGDSNLDGKVTGDDYVAIDANLGTLAGARWYEGDFNLDGKVTGDDYVAVDANLGKGTSDPLLVQLQSDMISLHTQMFGDAYASAVADAMAGNFVVVPEPASLTVLAFAGLLLHRRRRA